MTQRHDETIDQILDDVGMGQCWPPMIARTEELRDVAGPEQFEHALCAAIRGIGVTFGPNDASDFVRMLDLSLSFLKAA